MRRYLTTVFAGALVLASPAAAQCPDGTPPPCRSAPRAAATAAPAPTSVAVLYFENTSRDTSDNYIADGLTDEITARLGQVDRLVVTSRTSVRRLRANAATMSPTELGRTLNVTYLVNGTVRRAGARMRVTVELLRASNGVQVWADQIDRSADDLLDVQEEIAMAVAAGITGQLLPTERARLGARPTRVPAAYDLYLRGSHAFNVHGQEGLQEAIASLEAALRLDPTFTAARGRIAYAYAWAMNWDFPVLGVPHESLVTRGMEAADRALREDSSSADAWSGRGFLLFFQDPPRYTGALAALQRAVLLDSGNTLAHQNYAATLRRLGNFEAAEVEYRRALEPGPTRSQSIADIGFIHYSLRRYPEAAAWYDSAIVAGGGYTNWMFRARSRIAAGDTAGALEDAATAIRRAPASARIRSLATLAQMEAVTGDTAAARARLEPVLAGLAPGDGPVTVRVGWELAAALVALGERDRAILLLERIHPRGAWLWSYLIFRDFDPVRDDPRFQAAYRAAKPPGAPDPPAVR